ncbi:hypothetical protein TWF481_007332 [Arthrobotrys musiformis]|uniref:Uncharacterized protein n=1 Tax=Arthrobotrys musiformis TaxID=47236 RepID=A0AAV9WC55_9PEZI
MMGSAGSGRNSIYGPEHLVKFNQLKRLSKSGKKSKNVFKAGEQKCLSVQDGGTGDGPVVVDACSCRLGPCDKGDNINSPIPRFQWNIRGAVRFPDIESGYTEGSESPKGTYGEKQSSFWYGSIQSALNGKCLTYMPPETLPAPWTEGDTYGKIGDIVVKECDSSVSQEWIIWVFKKDADTRILPLNGTHFWPTCKGGGSKKNWLFRETRLFRGLVFNTDADTEKSVYFGCHDKDHTVITPHQWYFRVPDDAPADVAEKDLDKFTKDHLVDFA